MLSQKLNEEALAHASLKYNLELSTLKTDNSKLASILDSEKLVQEKHQTEVRSQVKLGSYIM